jgi:glycosyltransferase involved in cell wall biosynthesis
MAFSLPVVVSDIPANLEVGLPESCYVRTGSVEGLAERFAQLMPEIDNNAPRPDWSFFMKPYDWSEIAATTQGVYRSVIGGKSRTGL